jgi:hypothetical protein
MAHLKSLFKISPSSRRTYPHPGLDEVRDLFARAGFVSFVVDTEQLEGETLFVIRAMRDLCRMGA